MSVPTIGLRKPRLKRWHELSLRARHALFFVGIAALIGAAAGYVWTQRPLRESAAMDRQLAKNVGRIMTLDELLTMSARVAVNVSAKQLSLDANVVEGIRGILEETGVDPERIRLEITVSAMMSGPAALAMLKRIRELGVRFHLDDFGTGYSSLSYLHRMPLDALKIDQSVVRAMSTDPMSRSIVVAIVSLGHSLDMSVIAEGVETKEELDALRAMNCDAAQGYYLHRPMSADAADALLSAGERAWSIGA